MGHGIFTLQELSICEIMWTIYTDNQIRSVFVSNADQTCYMSIMHKKTTLNYNHIWKHEAAEELSSYHEVSTCHSWHKPVEKKRWTHTNTFEGERHPPHGWSFFSRIGWQNPAISTHSPISCRRTPRKKASFTLGVNSCERCGVSKYDGFITVEFLLIYHSNPPSRWHWCCLMPPIQANIIWDNNDT